MAKRSKSSSRWLAEHESDDFVKRARTEGWRSRAVFKLEEINKRDRLFKPGMLVVDLGAAPGAWSQYARHMVGSPGRVVALDILPMDPLPEVEFIQADFGEDEALAALRATLGDDKVDLVLSDIAPNMSGVAAVDQPKSMYLVELALEFSREALRPGGDFLCKAFHGEGFEAFMTEARRSFGSVKTRKPRASRPRSREVYILARNYRV
ncbi:MAG: 23S rRNA (uridine(2552)-2'-O)-methyltransferase RlmE [Gammaproteobacteria bacterium]